MSAWALVSLIGMQARCNSGTVPPAVKSERLPINICLRGEGGGIYYLIISPPCSVEQGGFCVLGDLIRGLLRLEDYPFSP